MLRMPNCFAMACAGIIMLFSTAARADVTVMISGGFASPYKELLPEFERSTGIKVGETYYFFAIE